MKEIKKIGEELIDYFKHISFLVIVVGLIGGFLTVIFFIYWLGPFTYLGDVLKE